jgi:hypothetical protein
MSYIIFCNSCIHNIYECWHTWNGNNFIFLRCVGQFFTIKEKSDKMQADMTQQTMPICSSLVVLQGSKWAIESFKVLNWYPMINIWETIIHIHNSWLGMAIIWPVASLWSWSQVRVHKRPTWEEVSEIRVIRFGCTRYKSSITGLISFLKELVKAYIPSHLCISGNIWFYCHKIWQWMTIWVCGNRFRAKKLIYFTFYMLSS